MEYGESRVASMKNSPSKIGLRKELNDLISSFLTWERTKRPSARWALQRMPAPEPDNNHDHEEYGEMDEDHYGEKHRGIHEEYKDSGIGSSMAKMSISGRERTIWQITWECNLERGLDHPAWSAFIASPISSVEESKRSSKRVGYLACQRENRN